MTVFGDYLEEVKSVHFGTTEAKVFDEECGGLCEIFPYTELIVVSPPHETGTVDVTVTTRGGGTSTTSTADEFTYASPIEKAEYKNWLLSGTLTPKTLGQAITLPEESTFNGRGEINPETGSGSVTGNLVVPPFTTTFKLFGLLPVNMGMTLAQTAESEGSFSKSTTIPGDETLTLPVKLNLGITSVGLLGLKIPTRCTTSEDINLNLVDTLTREELLTKGWHFSGTATLPRFECEGGFLGALFGPVLSVVISGPENAYTLDISAPSA